MTFSAAQIASLIQGKIEGDPQAVINSIGKIEEAKQGELTFFANAKYEEFLYSTKASIIIVNETYVLKQAVTATLIRVPDAYASFASLLTRYQEMMTQQLKGRQEPCYVARTAVCGENVFIGAFAYLGENVKLGRNSKVFPNVFLGDNVTVGEDCMIHPGVKIYHGCKIGNKVILHAGVVVGSDGFGFVPQSDGATAMKIPQLGDVVIEDNVEIGANTTIDRATIGSTIIRSGVKLDNLVQIAHNVEVGQNTMIAAQAGVSGSTKIGKGVIIGGQAGLAGHIQIADGSKINGQSGVSKTLKNPNSAVTGTPAFEYSQALRSQVVTRNLPEMEKRIKELETLVKQLLAERVSDVDG